MDSSVDVIASFWAMVGIAFAAILSAIGYWYRGRVESKRSARQVLYLLLEIRHALSASIFDSSKAATEYLIHYADRLSTYGFDIQLEEVETKIGEIVKDYFSRVAEISKTDINERLLQPFEDSLSRLSQDAPVLAYRLRGKEKLELLAKLNATHISKSEHGIIAEIGEQSAREAMLKFTKEMEKNALQKISNHLDEEILTLSFHCGCLEYVRCKKVLSVKFGAFDNKLFSELDKLIDELVSRIMEEANKSIQPTNG